MDVEIRPEPEPEERQAIEAALRRLIRGGAPPAAYTSAGGDRARRDSEPYAARPRKQLGATRA